MADPDVTLLKGQLLLKLLDIENSRCNAKTDEEERTDSLAQVLEGDDHIVARIHAGMAKYMALLGVEERPTPAMSIAEMQRTSVFRSRSDLENGRTELVPMSGSERALWEDVLTSIRNTGLGVTRATVMHTDLHRGSSNSPEDQLTLTIRLLR